MTRLKPNRLKPGDTLGIIAPSSPFQQDTFDQGLAVLQAMGFQTCLADGLFENQGYLAGSDERRSTQLQQMFADDSIQGIICARGGYGALRFLALLDFALIAKHPKPFIGFSDITALHQAFLTKANLVTFHGPMVCSLGKNDSASRKVMEDILTGMAVSKLMAAEPRPLRKGVAQGTVVGGNLATLCHLLATPFIQPLEGKVLLLEEVNEAPYRIDRVLTQMKMAGCFKGLAGVMVGQFEGCGPQELIEHILLDCFDDENLPIAAGFDVGHGQRNHTVVLGVQARLDTGRGILTYLEEPFEA